MIRKASAACKTSYSDSVMDHHNDQLVHATGMLKTDSEVGDPEIKYFRTNTAMIKRKV